MIRADAHDSHLHQDVQLDEALPPYWPAESACVVNEIIKTTNQALSPPRKADFLVPCHHRPLHGGLWITVCSPPCNGSAKTF